MKNQIEILKKIVDNSKKIVFFGGAGVSTESGIPDFRSVDGLYNLKYKYPPEEILSRTFFQNHTQEFFEFYRDKIIHEQAKPNKAHEKLAQWENEGRLIAIITQNIDGLHQQAGSNLVIELHGSIRKNHCVECSTFYSLDKMTKSENIPLCSCGGMIKPDVVLYEEPLLEDTIESAIQALHAADTLIIGGTSLNVYPAAGLVRYFRGQHLVIINKSALPCDNDATLVIREGIAKTLAQL